MVQNFQDFQDLGFLWFRVFRVCCSGVFRVFVLRLVRLEGFRECFCCEGLSGFEVFRI